MPHAPTLSSHGCVSRQNVDTLVEDMTASLDTLIATSREAARCGVSMDIDGDGKADFTAFDTNADGKIDTLVPTPTATTLPPAVDYPRGLFFEFCYGYIQTCATTPSKRIVEFGRATKSANWGPPQMKLYEGDPTGDPTAAHALSVTLYDLYSGAQATGGAEDHHFANTLLAIPAGSKPTLPLDKSITDIWRIALNSDSNLLGTLSMTHDHKDGSIETLTVSSYTGPFSYYISKIPHSPIPVAATRPASQCLPSSPVCATTLAYTVPGGCLHARRSLPG